MLKAPESWVVYLMTTRQKPEGIRAVCSQQEWDDLELARPGYHKLVQGGIATEAEAELLARGPSEDSAKPAKRSRWAPKVP